MGIGWLLALGDMTRAAWRINLVLDAFQRRSWPRGLLSWLRRNNKGDNDDAAHRTSLEARASAAVRKAWQRWKRLWSYVVATRGALSKSRQESAWRVPADKTMFHCWLRIFPLSSWRSVRTLLRAAYAPLTCRRCSQGSINACRMPIRSSMAGHRLLVLPCCVAATQRRASASAARLGRTDAMAVRCLRSHGCGKLRLSEREQSYRRRSLRRCLRPARNSRSNLAHA